MSSIREAHYFPNASNAVFSNFTITHGSRNTPTGSSERNGLRHILDNISKGAFHDAAERGDPPKCHPHTRVAIRAEIMQWINAPEARRKFIIWMYGPAGSGKTAIGQSIAEECKKKGLLAASFFFSRTAAGRNDTTRVVATIAYQISRFIPQVQEHLFTAIEQDPTIFSRALATQMQALVVEPLKALPPLPQPVFVILDGLDEAGPTSQDQANLLKVIDTATKELQHIPLIFLIASRPEYEIREAFNRHLSPITQSLVLDDNYKPDEDIRLYLTSMFEEICDKHIRLGTQLPSLWPSESDIDHLVSKASGQFIFAATVLKFIDSIRHHPVERLDIIFGLSAPGNETPFALLDALYYYILSSVAEPAKVLQILTMHMLRYPNTSLFVEEIKEVLDLDARRVLVDMHALVFVPPPSGNTLALRIHHTSLYDFLRDRSRSHDFYIDASQGHIDLTWRWWKVISRQLGWYMCLENFIHHYSKSPAGIEPTDDFARFDLKQHLEECDDSLALLESPWDAFFECIEQQAGDRDDIPRRMKAEFDAVILDRLSKYPPALQTYIPTVLALSRSADMADIFRILFCGFAQSIKECDSIFELDSTLLNLATEPYRADNAFDHLFEDECRAGKYYICNTYRSHLALVNQIVGITFPAPGQIKFEEDPFDDHIPVLCLPDGSLCVRLHNLELDWLPMMLLRVPQDFDLATLLRDRALQYDGHDIALKGGRDHIARGSLEYIQSCGIPYLNHVHPTGTNMCIICEECKGTSVVVDLDWQNEPRPDTAAFLPSSAQEAPSRAGEVGDHPNDLDEARTVVPVGPYTRPGFGISPPQQIFGNPSSALSSISEALSVAEPPTKPKRKRGEQSPPAKLSRSTRLKVKKAAS